MSVFSIIYLNFCVDIGMERNHIFILRRLEGTQGNHTSCMALIYQVHLFSPQLDANCLIPTCGLYLTITPSTRHMGFGKPTFGWWHLWNVNYKALLMEDVSARLRCPIRCEAVVIGQCWQLYGYVWFCWFPFKGRNGKIENIITSCTLNKANMRVLIAATRQVIINIKNEATLAILSPCDLWNWWMSWPCKTSGHLF